MAHEQVGRVLQAQLTPLANGEFFLDAEGQVGNANWKKPFLMARVGVVVDGNLDYDFMATPPVRGEITLPRVTKLRATANFGGPGTDLRGLRAVRIFAANGPFILPFPPR